MAKLEEIIKTEKSRSDSRTFSQIHLFKEGAFLRAYEQRVCMKWGNIIQMYKGTMPLLRSGFENKTAGVSDYNMFLKEKM